MGLPFGSCQPKGKRRTTPYLEQSGTAPDCFPRGHQPPLTCWRRWPGRRGVAGEIRRIPSLRDSSTERYHRVADPGVLAAWLRGHWQTEARTVHQHVHPGTGRQAADRFTALLEG